MGRDDGSIRYVMRECRPASEKAARRRFGCEIQIYIQKKLFTT